MLLHAHEKTQLTGILFVFTGFIPWIDGVVVKTLVEEEVRTTVFYT